MEPERGTDVRPVEEGSTSERALEAELSPAAAGPHHDETTSREAFELEMAEEGRSDEAAHYGDHIE